MSRGAIPRRPMTPDEITLARALAPWRVRYVPGSADKRFAGSIALEADQPAPLVTGKQGEYLLTLCIRMRRQLPADVLSIAERLSGQPLPPARRRRTTAALVLLAVLASGCRPCVWVPPGCSPPPAPAPRDSVPRGAL